MKKKIGDLTIRERIELCKRMRKCSECPLYNLSKSLPCDAAFYTEELDKLLDREIEVEDEIQNVKDIPSPNIKRPL